MISYEMVEKIKESLINGKPETWRNYIIKGSFEDVKIWKAQRIAPDGSFMDGDWRGMIINLDWKFPDRLFLSKTEAADCNFGAVLRMQIKELEPKISQTAERWNGHIRTNGNSQVVTVPSATMNNLGLKIGDEVEITIKKAE